MDKRRITKTITWNIVSISLGLGIQLAIFREIESCVLSVLAGTPLRE